ncbi:MAG TPA: cupredoxin domain-containing protein [Candidatus Limnocylindria bacterium]|nr:cupredoxin domain-containing protein [Candidatus Limnocylindria bacterium]
MHLSRSALRRAGILTMAVAATLALAACSSSSPSQAAESGDNAGGGGTATVTDGAVTITAENLQFDANVIQATAGEDFTITLVNNDSAPHNISLYTEEGGETIVTGDTADPGATVTVDVSGLDAGTYYFHCDIHPEMSGSVEVSG